MRRPTLSATGQVSVVLDLNEALAARPSRVHGAAKARHKNQRRGRPNNFPEPPSDIHLIWAKGNPLLRAYGPAQAVADLVGRLVWEDEVASVCRAVDESNARRNSKLIYPGDVMELLLFAQTAYGLKTVDGKGKTEVGLLTYLRNADRRSDLELLGFDRPRFRPSTPARSSPKMARASRCTKRTRMASSASRWSTAPQ